MADKAFQKRVRKATKFRFWSDEKTVMPDGWADAMQDLARINQGRIFRFDCTLWLDPPDVAASQEPREKL